MIDVTDGRFADTSPVFTLDGLYLAFLSQRNFDPVYDTHTFDLSFPLGGRPYLVPLAAQTPSPFGPMPGGRPLGQDNGEDPAAEARPARGRRPCWPRRLRRRARTPLGRKSRSTRTAWPGGWWPSRSRRRATAPCARSRADWYGCAPR